MRCTQGHICKYAYDLGLVVLGFFVVFRKNKNDDTSSACSFTPLNSGSLAIPPHLGISFISLQRLREFQCVATFIIYLPSPPLMDSQIASSSEELGREGRCLEHVFEKGLPWGSV